MADSVNTDRYVIRRTADVEEFRSVCGFRRSIITPEDTDAASVSHLRIHESREHYHKQMTEIYYVLSGEGSMVLDGEEHPIGAGDLVLIKPGVRHTSRGELEVLIVSVPPLESGDVWF